MAGFRSVLFLLGLSSGPPPPPVLFGLPAPASLVQLLVGDKRGQVLAEFRPLVGSVSWELSEAGAGSFSLPAARAREAGEALAHGNRVLLRFDNGLPDWVGVITGPIEWNAGGGVSVSIAGLAKIFAWRLTPAERRYDGKVSDVIGALLEGIPGLTVGEMGAGSGVVGVTYNYMKLHDAIRQLLPVDDFALDVEGRLVGSVIGGVVHARRRGAVVVESAILAEGHNLDDVAYRVEDAIVNVLHLVGKGEGWTPLTRAMVSVTDGGSVGGFDIREEAVFLDSVESATMLAALGGNALARSARPRQAVMATAMNRTPGTFAQYRVGDMVRVQAASHGVDGFFELTGREYQPDRNACEVVLEAR